MSPDIKVGEGKSGKPLIRKLCLVISVIICILVTSVYILLVFASYIFLGMESIGVAFTCVLLLGFTLFFCIIGTSNEKKRKRAFVKMYVSIFFATVTLSFLYISFFPAGTVPRFLRAYKFKRSCDCGFWLDYPEGKAVDIQSRYTFLFIRFGTVLYEGEPNGFEYQEVIDFAESHGWKYHCYVDLEAGDFMDYKVGKLEENYEDSYQLFDVFYYLTAYNYSPLSFETDCRVLVFDGGSVIGIASFVLVSNDGSRMMIRYSNPILPDGPRELWLTPGFDELCVRPTSAGNSIQVQ